ncbi:MAG: HlyD family efflux transporter periplasmic adaptor subunit [Caulobacteraceae bacterium]
MKRPPIPVILVVVVAVVAAGAWWLWPRQGPHMLSGYVEGEALYFSSPTSGALAGLFVERGQRVAMGAPLFQIDPQTGAAQQAQAQAAAAAAQEQVQDALKGQRPQELAVIRTQRAAALAQVEEARAQFNRVSVLAKRGFYPPARLDQDRATLKTAEAQYQETARRLDVAELGARSDQVAAAKSRAVQAQAVVAEANARLNQLAPHAPDAARVEEVFFRQGEWAPANQPVVSLLPDARVKLRFFVPEAALPAYRPGQTVRFTCDGCRPQTARINYVSPRAEFTPPVIYSRENRDRLVFLIEAAPERPRELAPGQPVDVTPLVSK